VSDRALLREIRDLADALVDGMLTPYEAARLEGLVARSEAGRQCLVECLQLHAELTWEHCDTTPMQLSQELRSVLVVPEVEAVRHQWRWRVYVMAASLLVAVSLATLFAVALLRERVAPQDEAIPDRAVARLRGTLDAEWSTDAGLPPQLTAQRRQPRLLTGGFAELEFQGGARVVLHGPARFTPLSPHGGRLLSGRLSARVPARARGFEILTPNALVVDLGTEFGVAVTPEGSTEVEVFRGEVFVAPRPSAGEDRPPGAIKTSPQRRLTAGEAVQVTAAMAEATIQMASVATGRHGYVTSLPVAAKPANPRSRLRALVAANPHLRHHYTFRDPAAAPRGRDAAGGLHLVEFPVGPGGPGQPASAEGSDTDAPQSAAPGVCGGFAVHSETAFRPPLAMTIETLLRYDPSAEPREGAIGTALGIRASRRECGFLVAVLGQGRLAHLIDAHAPWHKSGFYFQPGHDYYLACTFRQGEGGTLVNAYVADLSDSERSLRHVVVDEALPGAVPSGRLAVGFGYDGKLVPAYPWPGQVDDIAIYDAAFAGPALETHLKALVARPNTPADRDAQ